MMINFIIDYKLIDRPSKEQLERIKKAETKEVIRAFDQASKMIIMINTKFYSNTLFCCKYRIYRNILKLLYIDIVRFYRICYFCVNESDDKIKQMTIDQAKSIYKM